MVFWLFFGVLCVCHHECIRCDAMCVLYLYLKLWYRKRLRFFFVYVVVSLHFTRLAFDLKQINHQLCGALAFKCLCTHTRRERCSISCVVYVETFSNIHSHTSVRLLYTDIYLVAIYLHFYYYFAVVHHLYVAKKLSLRPARTHTHTHSSDRKCIETERDGKTMMARVKLKQKCEQINLFGIMSSSPVLRMPKHFHITATREIIIMCECTVLLATMSHNHKMKEKKQIFGRKL